MKKSHHLKSHRWFKLLNMGYFALLKNAPRLGMKTAWVTSGAPVELLIAMGIVPFYPENFSAFAGVTKTGSDLIKIAERHGYSRDLCSYYKAHVGAQYPEANALLTVPKPDMLLCCNNICKTVVKWYEDLATMYNVPIVFYDTPFVHEPEISEEQTGYLKEQVLRMIKELENITKKKINYKKLKHVLAISHDTLDLWEQIHQTGKNHPSPITAFDAFIHLGPIVNMRGTVWAKMYYSHLLKEIQTRVKNKVSSVKNEKIRLLWDNIAIWHNLGKIASMFNKHNAALVIDTYTTAWASNVIDSAKPIESLALAYADIYLNRGTEYKYKRIKAFIEEYDIDAVIMHSNRSCKPYSIGQLAIKKRIQEQLGKPVIVFEADMIDPEKINIDRLDSLLTTLEEMI